MKSPIVPALLLVLLAGCSETIPDPVRDTTGSGDFTGFFEPGGGFVLRATVLHPSPDRRVHVDLIGENLRIGDGTEEIAVDVSIRNAETIPLRGPAEVLLFRFRPDHVFPVDVDSRICPGDSLPPVGIPASECIYVYDYTAALGADGVLLPGETSEARTWVFRAVGLPPFSFGARARFGLTPERPVLAGGFYVDLDRDGDRDPGEPAFTEGYAVQVDGPGLEGFVSLVGSSGSFRVPVTEPGLYRLLAFDPLDRLIGVRVTSPNPLQVLLPPGPDGNPLGYRNADFGVVPGLPLRPIEFIEPGDAYPDDPYSLREIRLDGRLIHLRVQYSGCQPYHPFRLLMVGGIMESHPPQARLVLSHDGLEEFCRRAAFETMLTFDLRPLLDRLSSSGEPGGTLILRFVDYVGEIHTVVLDWVAP